MFDDAQPGNVLFEAPTPLEFRVRATRSSWELIVTVKHPAMAGQDFQVKQTLQDPDEIRQSRTDPAVHLFYKSVRQKRWTCAVVKRADQGAFLITAYPTDNIKEGVKLWPM